MIGVPTNAVKVIAGLDLDLLDEQITRLHELELLETLTDQQRAAVTGLCEFLSLLHRALAGDRPGMSAPLRRFTAEGAAAR